MKKIFLPLLLSSLFVGLLIVVYYKSRRSVVPPAKITVSQPTSTPFEPTVQPSETWQSYRDERYGIEFKYPSYFTPNDFDTKNDPIVGLADKAVNFQPAAGENTAEIGFDIFPNDQDLSLTAWVNKYEKCGVVNKKPLGQSTSIDGINVYRIDDSMSCPPGGGSKFITVYISQNRKVYEFYILSQGGHDVGSKDVSTLFQIIASVKFFQPIPMGDSS